MAQDHRIPAASIEGVDVDRICAQSSDAASEIVRIDELLGEGRETPADLIRLSDLLAQYGEKGKAEDLLRSNVVRVGDVIYNAYRERYGDVADQHLERSVRSFQDQFGVRLHRLRQAFLKLTCLSMPEQLKEIGDPRIARFLADECEVDFAYDHEGCSADIASESPDLPETAYLILRFRDGLWRVVAEGGISP